MTGRIDSVSRLIAASPLALYQAFMDPDSLVTWMPPEGMSGEIDYFKAEAGGGYRMTLTYEEPSALPGKTTENTDTFETAFIQLVPGKKIAGRTIFETDDPDAAGELLMTWFFEEVDGETKLTLIAENVPPGIPKAVHIEGLNSTLDNLEDFVGYRTIE